MSNNQRRIPTNSAARARAQKNASTENNSGEQALNENALKASEIRYRRLFETAQVGILIVDAGTGQIEDANPFMEIKFGYRQSEMVGKSLWEIGLVKDQFAYQAMYQDLKKNGFVRYDDLPLLTKKGLLKYVEFICNIYAVDNQTLIQCNIRDISLHKETEAKAESAHNELVVSMAKLQRNEQELHLIYQMNDLLQSCNSQADAYQVIQWYVSELFNGTNGCLAILRPQEKYLDVVASWGNASFVEPVFSLDDCWALRLGHIHVVKEPKVELVCKHFTQPIQTNYLCVPLVVQGETLGLLFLTCPNDTQFQRQQHLVEIVGDAIKLSLSNIKLREKLREQALTDQLTGLGNRYYLEDNLSRELARMLRRETSVCVAMLDIDHFKDFNDTYGHDAGDMVLRKFGAVLREHLRESDIKCRYGGEEFVVVLIDTSLAEVCQRLDNIREIVKKIEIQNGEDTIGGVTLSIGIVEAHEYDWTTKRLLRAADEALYAAKRAGRDQIAVYPTVV